MMTKDQTIALIKAIQQAAVFMGKSMMEIKVPGASITDDIEALDDSIEEIIKDIPDDTDEDQQNVEEQS